VHVTSEWNHVYPFRVAEGGAEDSLLPVVEEWRENLSLAVATALKPVFGRAVTVEEVAWFVFGVLSAPAYRARYATSLAIDHPRIPFPTQVAAFDRMSALGKELGRAHLLEAPLPDDVRFEGLGSNHVEAVRFDAPTSSVWINASQRFTGVPSEAWTWGLGFRPLEHYLDDRKGRILDLDQIQGFQGAIVAVRTSIELAPALDAALDDVLANTLDLPSP
jgi:hypothetical protein